MIEPLDDAPPAAQAEPLPPTDAAPLHPSLPLDEYHGKAGSYVYDPETRKRTPVRDTE